MNKSTVVSAFAIVLFCFSFSFSQIGASIDPLIAHIDSTVKPGNDFFLYANGKWFKENPIPASEASNGLWQIIQDTINEQIRNVCESSAAITNAEKGSNKQKIGDFFRTGMDSIALNAHGIADLKNDIAMIDKIKNLMDVAKAAANLHVVAGAPLFRFGVAQDDRISSKNAIFISQGGLSLPDRRFYLDTDERSLSIRQKFVEHIGRMFKIIGYNDSKSQLAATNIMKLETAIATTSRKKEDTRDPVKNYNKISYKQLLSSTPHFDWTVFAENAGFRIRVDTVIVGQPEFLTALDGYLQSFSLENWKDYLKYHLVSSLARYVDDKTYLENFSFYSTVLRGVPEPKPRWKRVVEQSDRSLGELIGQVYCAESLPKGTKEKLLEIGNAIKRVYAERIKNLDWMSEATKEKALKKLNTVIMKVGYPDKWKDLSSMEIDRSSFVKNVMNANAWDFGYMISKYGKPVDRTEWDMQPQTYNAYYNPSNNEICVPGCNIIVPGYERVLADDALLYSIIGGSTFGHEITHGFDDQGCQYDENGNLNNWWTAEDSSKFFAKTKMIVKQFDGYIAVDSLHINGELTQGENIADLAGVMMGFEAFKNTLQFKNNEIIAGLNPNQRFFLAYAFAWMINMRPEGIASQVKSDVHSPAKFRVIGPLADIPEFYTTFHIQEGDVMWRPENLRVKIW
ncbi:MAG: M13 family metallopeptidase [Ignavibacteriales bacterium]|nr:M13 family metallopeptidase [Ignavibacteriales bacterium]